MADRSTAQPLSSELKTALDGRLATLIKQRALSPARATRAMDGRLVPIVFVTVFDEDRRPAAGFGLELRDAEGKIVDRVAALRGGFGIVRFPKRSPHPEGVRGGGLADGGDVVGTVHLMDGSTEVLRQAVRIGPAMQADAVQFVRSSVRALNIQYPPGDDPLRHLPIDFSEQACELLMAARTNGVLDPNNLTTRADPLLSPPGGTATIAGERFPLFRRTDVIRYGEDGLRYLVRLRQEWVLLTYTLGELAEVKALDPGAVVQSATQLASQVTSAVGETVNRAKSTLTDTLQDSLARFGSVDSVVRTVQSTTVGASGSGWYIGIPGLVGYGSAGGDVNTTIDLNVTTNVNTSLLVNRIVQQVSTLVNEAISQVHAASEAAQRATMDVVNQIAPLVHHVTNALHWRVYEVYAVCTNVDAVYAIEEVDLFAGTLPDLTADDVLAYRPFFEPVLLDPTLASAFDALRAGAEQSPITQATFNVTYRATMALPMNAPLRVTLEATLPSGPMVVTRVVGVPTGPTRTETVTLAFTQPIPRGNPVTVTLRIASIFLTSGLPLRAEVWIDRPLTGPGFVIDNTSNANPWTFTVPLDAGSGATEVLVRHVNRNKSYYYGVLAAAAIYFPSLRTDVTVLAGLDPRLWQLPLLGMEGTTALLLNPTASNVNIDTLLEDPGAGTLVQILAPGSYGEVLTGVLQLVGQLHPLMTQLPTVPTFPAFPTLPGGVSAAPVAGLPIP